MTATPTIPRSDMDLLVDEMERYLDAVRLFREEGCEPHWSPEMPVATPEPASAQMPLFVAD